MIASTKESSSAPEPSYGLHTTRAVASKYRQVQRIGYFTILIALSWINCESKLFSFLHLYPLDVFENIITSGSNAFVMDKRMISVIFI